VSRHCEESNPGPPAYMVSFSDMMTLILTFFILLVSLSREQSFGLLADGVGSFRIALESHGVNGLLMESDRKAIFENQRRRFNLPERLEGQAAVRPEDASVLELLRAESIEALLPHDELTFPAVAAFDSDSADLASPTARYIATLAESLRPTHGQLLVLEGHAPLADRLLAWRRADAVRTHLITEHGFTPDRVEARAWMTELDGAAQDAVDARLITPALSSPPRTMGDQPENHR